MSYSNRLIFTSVLLRRINSLLISKETSLLKMFSTTDPSPEKTYNGEKKEHLELTNHSTRHDVISWVNVRNISQLSPTVKTLTIEVEDKELAFYPGQWVDVFLPGIDTISGYSMCSSPLQLCNTGTIDLAVKYSNYPPTAWFHEKCEIGSKFRVRVGGDFYYNPIAGDKTRDILLVAGGVGVNPLLSMFLHLSDIHRGFTGSGYRPGKTLLLFTAKEETELLYKERIVSACEGISDMQCEFFLTGDNDMSDLRKNNSKYSRIDLETLRSHIGTMNKERIDCYVCGPPQFIDHIEIHVKQLGLQDHQIHYEKWS